MNRILGKWNELDEKEKQALIFHGLVGATTGSIVGLASLLVWSKTAKSITPAIRQIFENEDGDVVVYFRNGVTKLFLKQE
jgi:hypothetical protein